MGSKVSNLETSAWQRRSIARSNIATNFESGIKNLGVSKKYVSSFASNVEDNI